MNSTKNEPHELEGAIISLNSGAWMITGQDGRKYLFPTTDEHGNYLPIMKEGPMVWDSVSFFVERRPIDRTAFKNNQSIVSENSWAHLCWWVKIVIRDVRESFLAALGDF